MTDKHAGAVKGFTHLSKAWYANAVMDKDRCLDEIMIGFYYPNEGGGTTGEFGVRWSSVGGNVTPRLEVFDDGWHALSKMPELIQFMAEVDGQNITPDAFAKALEDLGFQNLTKTVQAD